MAKHIKTNKIKKRKAAKKTLRKTKRIRQKGKKQSGGFNFFLPKEEREKRKIDKKFKEFFKNSDKKANPHPQCNIIINATFYPYESKEYNISNIKSKLNGKGKEEVATNIVTNAIKYWKSALNGVKNDREYFGRSANMFKSNPLIKICITKQDETGALILQQDFVNNENEDHYVILKPFEEKDQFKNYEKYQSKPQPQKNTNNNPKKPNDSQEFVRKLKQKRVKEQERIEQKYNKEYQIKNDINAKFNEKYNFIETGALKNDSEYYYYYNFPCRSSIHDMSGTKDNEKWKNNKYYILHPENLDDFFIENETEELAKEIKILTDRTQKPVKLTGEKIDYYFPPTDDVDDRLRDNYIAAREIYQPLGNAFGNAFGIGITDSCKE